MAYPIALLTVDELMMAGAKYNAKNLNFYLYNAKKTGTMTPYNYANWYGHPRITVLDEYGNINYNAVQTARYVRPVINLRSDIKITSGDGMADDPFVISLS